VPRMREVEVDTFDAQPLQARVDLAAHAVRREPAVLPFVHRVEGLGREAKPCGAACADPLADVRLAAAAAVRVRGVEPRARGLQARVHELERLLEGLALAKKGGRRADP